MMLKLDERDTTLAGEAEKLADMLKKLYASKAYVDFWKIEVPYDINRFNEIHCKEPNNHAQFLS